MPSPGQKIFDAESEGLYDFVSKNGRGLYIPPYQRDYAWDKTNVERLIDDTIQGLNALLKRPDESITFIGTIIAMNDSKKSTISPLVKNQVYTQVMSVIDGQQRLTTLLMLCLALLLEIEVQWADLKKGKAKDSDDARQWLETRVNDMRGLLSQMLSERQNNGEGEFRHFPKMIRAFVDTWSYEADKATYNSPISWLLFEFVRFREQLDPNWAKFPNVLKETADGAANEGQRKHFIKMLKVMRDKLRNLPGDDEFPELLGIVQDEDKQDTLFGEEFPDSMKTALESVLSPQFLLAQAAANAGEKPSAEDARSRKWWDASTNLVSLLFFAKFALERITLVVVTATTEDFAFDVFEALNTTGQPLTALETFVPKVVQSVGMTKYNSSEEKKQLEIAGDYIRKVNRADERQKRSADLLVAFALAELGEKRSKNLADQRRFMREAFDSYSDRKQQQEFIRHLAELSRFFDSVWVNGSDKPNVDGLQLPEPAALCLRFLVDFGHTITAPLLAQYAADVGVQKDAADRKKALNTFCEVVQAVTAFTVLWRSSRSTTDRIDEVYRSLMSEGSLEHGVPALARGKRADGPLPTVQAVQAALVSRLQADRKSKKHGANIAGKAEWIEKTVAQPLWEVNTTLARFVLLLAFHDVVEGADGHLTRGKAGSNPTLTLDAWVGDQFTSIEHIAPRSKAKGWSQDLYQDEEFERLGNLTLVPTRCNSSLSDRPWDQKRSLFAALSAKTENEAKTILKTMADAGIDVTEVAGNLYAGQYLPHVHAIGNVKGEWNLDAVNARGRELADLVWQRLSPWIGWTNV
ncbi:DUF262 domain-containing HNH endonuclease family protein [Acidovorax sp. SUPP2825]|uniref:DUF262 domain-containing HNH endonuclease family protein n=1 Tax=Acidovorax sp. SUPP2825 TaxID=2920879 RepID=UPI0023DE537D|nr:DUF262 domain-containing HNH endonuclease family protein [Acidovorax sp. SUPP2825]GKS95197.1 hypothetical protein AVAK2825_11700 [Acidovorax sp. SUPP2825]